MAVLLRLASPARSGVRQVSASMVCDESMLPDLDAAQLAALYLQATQGDHEKKRTRALLNSYARGRGCT